MRLTHLKLAGFKSFVDATTLHIHGQRVGVVGPNGCGKSNVMESVRWVLGESSAKEMRGDSMDAVIFNGSGNRKAISRASVELMFDNSLGGAAGSWSQYAEISIKRVIEREKGSTYYINNTVVRRRDVADLFLGTGLGGRAYAIIGQNTINKIVEAKPEELRIFLEEAAGISKYKERRRETELRLRDTRENLTRVEDILRELTKQITRLEAQAVVTGQYHSLQAAYKLTQGQYWLIKKREAGIQQGKSQRGVDALVNELEAQMASLRGSESGLESMRQAHFDATDAVNKAQAAYYEVNAEVSNLEQQVRHTTEARERVQAQLLQITTLTEKNAVQAQLLQQDLARLNVEFQKAGNNEQQAFECLAQVKLALPNAEAAYKEASAAHSQGSSALLETEQRIRLETANIDHLTHNIQELELRLQKLSQELSSLHIPQSDELLTKKTAQSRTQLTIAGFEKNAALLLEQDQAQQAVITQSRANQTQAQRQLNQVEAEIASLNKIQQSFENSAGGEAKLKDWLKQVGLQNNPRLWQKISIKKGWGVALEAVLGAKLNAISSVDEHYVNHVGNNIRPPTALVVITNNSANLAPSIEPSTAPKILQHSDLTPLLSVIEYVAPELNVAMQAWLADVYLLNTGDDALAALKQMSATQMLVNEQGDIYTQYSVAYHGAQSNLHGILERKSQLSELQNQCPTLQAALNTLNLTLNEAEQGLQRFKLQQQLLTQQLKMATQDLHQLSLDCQRLQQQQQHAQERQQTLHADIHSTEHKLQTLLAQKLAKQTLLASMTAQTEAQNTTKIQAEQLKQQAEIVFNQARDAVQDAEKNLQEAVFSKKINNNNINELNNRLQVIVEEKNALTIRSGEAETSLAATKMETLKANLGNALNAKQQCELALSAARNNLSECEHNLQNQERLRMQSEQQLHPMRDKLEQSRLSEQQARLYFEQCQAELLANGLNEEILSANLNAAAKASDLEQKITNLALQIAELGAVNLAAIQELTTEQTRLDYLASQSQDLTDASNTLEDAIRKIDKETRGRLQATFDAANRHFDELFKTLFSGGQARLELLGDEILDTGMQVFAQPPGKRNSTIHLLSGGEKALTALALVFALFKLNPAPFCLMDEVDAPLDDSNTERFCEMVKKMSEKTQFLFISHNKITMEMAQQLIGVTMQESGVSRIVEVDIDAAMAMSA